MLILLGIVVNNDGTVTYTETGEITLNCIVTNCPNGDNVPVNLGPYDIYSPGWLDDLKREAEDQELINPDNYCPDN